MKVWPGGGGGEGLEVGRVEIESADDVLADRGGGSCSETDDGDGGKGGAEIGEVDIGSTEVMTPFGDAMASSMAMRDSSPCV